MGKIVEEVEDTGELKVLSVAAIGKFLLGKRMYVIAEETGISYPTLAKFNDNPKHNFTIDVLVKMTHYIKKYNLKVEQEI